MAAIVKLARDSRGTYRKDVGWKLGDGGKLVQHRYYLGTVRHVAEQRALRLDALWAAVEIRFKRFNEHLDRLSSVTVEAVVHRRALWTANTLAIGMALARGENECEVDPAREPTLQADTPLSVAEWHGGMVRDFGYLGVRLSLPVSVEVTAAEGRAHHEQEAERHGAVVRNVQGKGSCHTLHDALDAYADAVLREHRIPGTDRPTEWAVVQRKEVLTLKASVVDRPLSAFDNDAIESLIHHWRHRPIGARGKPVAPRFAVNLVKRIRAFVRWLHKSSKFDWRKPLDYEVTAARVVETPAERSARAVPDRLPIYTVEDIETLYLYATPLQRAFLLLGLNCAFGTAEIGTLMLNEIKVVGGETYCKRVRHKSGVYGEWLLWPETVAAIEWAKAQRPTTDRRELFLTDEGRPYNEPTEAGNRGQKIPNVWARLYGRIAKDHATFPNLSFNKLRKTSANLIGEIGGAEVASVQLSHGNPLPQDGQLPAYLRPLFARLFGAQRELYGRLAPVFAKVADPFPVGPERHPVISIGTIRSIQAKKRAGKTNVQIAAETGIHRNTVARYVEKKVKAK